jgi:eukaryotic-like serine/threonine-protein kinase
MFFLKFLISKTFLKHLGIAVAGLLLMVWLVLTGLRFYTNHGEAIEVPGLTGVQLTDLEKYDKDGNFRFIVIDSIFDEQFSKGAIVLQDPPPGSHVKRGRKVYLTVVAMQPETVIMPDLVDLSLRQALAGLKANGLRLANLDYIPNMARNAVLEQKHYGDTIAPGTEILKGSEIELVLGRGLRNELVNIPFVIGKTEAEAIALLNQSSFNLGYLTYTDQRDRMHSRVYMQQPMGGEGERAEMGTYVDLWFRSDIYFDFDSLLRSFEVDTLHLQEQLPETENLVN